MLNRHFLSRRRALQLGLAGLAGTGAWVQGLAQRSVSGVDDERDVAGLQKRDGDLRSLKERAAAKGLFFGAAGGYSGLSAATNLVDRYIQDCTVLVPENDMKWKVVRPTPEQFDFARGDWLVQLAQTHQMQVRGHTLVWDQGNPPWLKEFVTPQNGEQLMVDHIQAMMRRYPRSVIQSWDVVNEVLDSRKADNLRLSPWLDALGPGYIDLAFRTAAAVDPDAVLVFNDAWLEYESRQAKRARAAALDTLRQLKDQGTPVHAFGIQAHLEAHLTHDIDYADLRNFLRDLASLGLKILITELDVNDVNLPLDVAVRDCQVATAYEEYLSVVLEEPAVIGVITWGLSDRHTWMTHLSPRQDGASPRPLPLDANLNRKPAWFAIARALDQAPNR